ncbi:MAG: DUF5667 domain-containing protein [Minisyncoccia bacterium]
MFKKISFCLLFSFLVLIIPLSVYFLESAYQVKADQERVIYDLPYPGLLPDHPLYFLKAIRDRLNDWLTRDYIKKAQLYLLYSDKRANSSLFLAKKGRNNLAISTLSKAEKYFLKIPSLLKEAKKQGQDAPAGFIEKLKLANAKHREIADNFLKTMPQGLNSSIIEVIKINEQIKNQLEKF